MRTGFLMAHEQSQQEVFHQCVTASAVATYGQTVNHDAEVMFYHHLFAQIMNEVEDAGYSAEHTMQAGHPAEAIFDRIMEDASSEEDGEFYTETAHLYQCLSPQGVIAKLQKLVDCMESEQPLSPDSAEDPVLQDIIAASDRFKSAVLTGKASELSKIVLEQTGKLPSNLLSQDKFEQYLVGMLTGTEDEPDMISTYDDDGYMLCGCAFCDPRLKLFERVRQLGEVPKLMPLQEIMIELVGLSLEVLDSGEEGDYEEQEAMDSGEEYEVDYEDEETELEEFDSADIDPDQGDELLDEMDLESNDFDY